jgi:hypothetical protein
LSSSWKSGLTAAKAQGGEESADKGVNESEDGGTGTWLYNAKELVKEKHRCGVEYIAVVVRDISFC